MAVIFAVALANQHGGHDWGDDFSLYLRQTKALVSGGARDVLADNRFTIENSSWHTFSPYSYPWGFPLLLAPFYKIFGLDYGAFKVVIAACFAGAMYFLYRIAAPRMRPLPALVLMLLIGLSPEYVAWTDTVLSEFPYLLVTLAALWWMDRCRSEGSLDGDRWGPLILLGWLVGFSYTIRKEGVALFVALVALHIGHIAGTAWRSRRVDDYSDVDSDVDADEDPDVEVVGAADAVVERPDGMTSRGAGAALQQLRWSRLLTPYLVAGAWIVGLQVGLPNGGYQSFPGTGLGQVRPNAIWYRDILAQQIGLKQFGVATLGVFGSEQLGLILLTAIVTLAVIGVVARSIMAPTVDAPVLGYFVAVTGIFAITPFHEGRYLFSITPFIMYFAYQAMVFIAGNAPSPVPMLAGMLLIAPSLVTNVDAIWERTDRQLQYDVTIWGPEYPTSLEMFSAVKQLTGPDDVVAFFRARLMSFYTDRRALQLTTLPEIEAKADWYAMAKDSTYSQYLLTDAEAAALGIVKRWENTNFILWQVPQPPPGG